MKHSKRARLVLYAGVFYFLTSASFLEAKPVYTASKSAASSKKSTARGFIEQLRLSKAEIPAGCVEVKDLFILNGAIGDFYAYKGFGEAMPALVRKDDQSFRCGGQTGSFLFFEFRNAVDRGEAQTFARDLFVRVRGYHPLILDAGPVLVVVSFNEPPSELFNVIDGKVSKARDAAQAVDTEKMERERMESLKKTVEQKSTDDGKAPVAEAPVAAAPTRAVKGTIGDTPDIADATVVDFRSQLHCDENTDQGDATDVCSWLSGFLEGERPTLTQRDGYFGRSFIVDLNRRLVEATYEGLFPSESRLGRGQLKSSNAVDDYELRSIMDAARQHGGIPKNPSLEKLQSDSAKRSVHLAPTRRHSMFFKDDQSRRCYLRQTKDNSLVLLCVVGESAERQLFGELVIAGYY